MLRPYTGPRPAAAGREGKYSVVYDEDGSMVVRLIYPIDRTERALLTTRHDAIVEMVNLVKEQVNGVPGGVFYLNEYKQVLVPAGDNYYLAGRYDPFLTFDLDGQIISPQAPSDLRPGDPWPGPRVGMTYTLAAGETDIYCEYERAPGRIVRQRLSDICTEEKAMFLAERIAETKGRDGGRIRINEAQEFFGPVLGHDAPLYFGPLDGECWFPPVE